MLKISLSSINDLNIEDLRIALFNYILSKKLNESLLIEIEDCKKNEENIQKDKKNLELLELFSIGSSHIIYQSDSLKYHQKMAMQLLVQKKAFSCFCSNEKLKELEQDAKINNLSYRYDDFCSTLSDETVLSVNAPFTIRIKAPENKIKINDLLNSKLENLELLDSFIILNHEKKATYNYASAITDMLYDITTIVKNEYNFTDSLEQTHIRQSLGYDKKINYLHVNKITNGNISINSLIEDGYLPVAIANYLVLLGNKVATSIFSLEDAVEWFDVNNLSKETLFFDIEELKQINKTHLELLDNLRLSKLLGFSDNDIGKLGKLYLKNCYTLKEIKIKIENIFIENEPLKNFEKEFVLLKNTLKNTPFFEEYNDFEKYIFETTNLEKEVVLKLLNYIFTNQDEITLHDIYPHIKNYLGEIVK